MIYELDISYEQEEREWTVFANSVVREFPKVELSGFGRAAMIGVAIAVALDSLTRAAADYAALDPSPTGHT